MWPVNGCRICTRPTIPVVVTDLGVNFCRGALSQLDLEISTDPIRHMAEIAKRCEVYTRLWRGH